MNTRNVPAGFVRREATGYNLCGREEEENVPLGRWIVTQKRAAHLSVLPGIEVPFLRGVKVDV